MNRAEINNWQAVRNEVLRRIHSRRWKPGDFIPNEVDLAREFGCARATVNRALRALAEAGMLDRRRKAGTRVTLHPVSKATLDIPVIRLEIEDRAQSYGYQLLRQDMRAAPPEISALMGKAQGDRLCRIKALHSADSRPYVLEDRWINPVAVPQLGSIRFETISANEWLLTNAPYTHGDISFCAGTASNLETQLLGAQTGNALFIIERTTWDHDVAITIVRLAFAPGYRMRTVI